MATIEQSNNITTTNGNFYSGMTYQDAIKKRVSLSIFAKIDKLDGNVTGTLSDNDIFAFREEEASDKTHLSVVGGIAGVVSVVAAIAFAPEALLFSGLLLIGAAYNGSKAYLANKETEKMKEQVKKENLTNQNK